MVAPLVAANYKMQLQDVHILEAKESHCPNSIHCYSNLLGISLACSIIAILTWKIFIFGGIGGAFTDVDRLGTVSNAND